MRFLRRLMLFAILAGVATTITRRLLGNAECGAACECSAGTQSCTCGHATCLAPAEA